MDYDLLLTQEEVYNLLKQFRGKWGVCSSFSGDVFGVSEAVGLVSWFFDRGLGSKFKVEVVRREHHRLNPLIK